MPCILNLSDLIKKHKVILIDGMDVLSMKKISNIYGVDVIQYELSTGLTIILPTMASFLFSFFEPLSLVNDIYGCPRAITVQVHYY